MAHTSARKGDLVVWQTSSRNHYINGATGPAVSEQWQVGVVAAATRDGHVMKAQDERGCVHELARRRDGMLVPGSMVGEVRVVPASGIDVEGVLGAKRAETGWGAGSHWCWTLGELRQLAEPFRILVGA